MQEEPQAPRKVLSNRLAVVIGASVALHAIVVGLFFLKMPDQAPQVPKEETVQVELVPPPDETPKPPEPKPEPKPEIKPEAKPPEPKPEQKPPEQKAEPPPKPPEQPPEPPKPEPPKPEQAQKPPPPPPPAPPPPEQQEKKPQEQQPPPPPQQADDQKRQQSPIPTLRPVVEFADKDSGPRKALDGSSSTDGSTDDAKDDKQSDGAQADKPADTPADQPADTPDGGTLSDAAARQMAAAEESVDKSAEAPRGEADGSGDKDGLPSKDIADKAASTTKGTAPGEPMDHLPGVRLPDEVKVPEVDQAGAVLPKHGGGGAETDAEQAELVPALRKGSPDGKAEGGQAAGGKPAGGGMAKAKTLYSEKDSGDPVARTAMGNLPRETRASELCVTELKAQILHASPPYRPELLPSPRMPQGTVLEVRQGAFRANSRWYNLSFRCEIDQNATKVLSFAFDIGDAVPRGDWQKRGFPVF